MAATLQDLRPVHGTGIKRNPWPGIIGAGLIVLVVVYSIASGLASLTINRIRDDLKASVVKQEVKNELPPPPPPPDFKPPPVVAVQSEVAIDLKAAPPPRLAPTPPPPPAPPRQVEAPPPPPPSSPVATTSHAVTIDDYPAISVRLQEQGVVKIKYTIGTDGTVADCTVTASSGKPRLDDAACAMVKKRWKFKPASQNGKPVAFTQAVDVKFQLQ